MHTAEITYNVDLEFESVRLPMITDMLVIGKKVPQGKNGIMMSFQLIAPDVFELLDIGENDTVEAVIVNKSILRKLPKERILSILKQNVFPHVVKGETLKVDFSVQIFHNNIKGEVYERVELN